MSGLPNLTPRQAAFIPEFLASGNATASAIKAGFSVKGASVAGTRMLRNASVQKALQARQAADATRLSIKRENVLNGLLEAVDLARAQLNPMAMISAWKQVSLLMGYNSAQQLKVEMSPDGLAMMNHLERLSNAELVKIIEAGQLA